MPGNGLKVHPERSLRHRRLRRGGTIRQYDMDTDRQTGHVLLFVPRPVVVNRRQPVVGTDVKAQVTMEDPVAGMVGRLPRHPHGLPAPEFLGHGQSSLIGSIVGVRGPVALAVDPEEVAVQVHRVVPARGVDPVPADRITHHIGEALGVGPGLAVYHQHGGIGRRGAGSIVDPEVPNPHDKDAVDWTLARWIDDDRARQLALDRRTPLGS